jgi:aminopeptidase N
VKARVVTLALAAGSSAPAPAQEADARAAYDVKEYRIELLIDPAAQTIRGFGAVGALVTAPTLDVLELDLEHHLLVQSAHVVDGDLARDVLDETRPLDWTRDGDRLRVTLEKPAHAGDRVQVSVAYAGRPLRVDDSNGFQWARTPSGAPWVATSCQTIGAHTWFPCKASFFHPEDKPDRVVVNVTAPQELVAASNGRLVDVSQAGAWKTWRWRLDAPLPDYAIAIDVAPYVLIESEVELPGLPRKLPVRFYVLPESEAKARKQFAEVPEILKFFSEKFGPYPYPEAKFALAETPIWGMEHATLVSYGSSFPDAIRGTGVVDPFELRNKLYDYVLVHETAHEWWGNAISCADWGDFWLHEGFAAYAETLWVEHVHGQEAALDFMQEKKRGLNELTTVWRPRHATCGEAWDPQMYDKGAWLLHMLRYVIGDAAFFASLREFATDPRLRFKSATSADFQAICEKNAGTSLRTFFQPWLYGTRWPGYTVHRPKLEGSKATVSIECKCTSQFPFEMPLDVEAELADGGRFRKRVTLVKGVNSITLEVPPSSAPPGSAAAPPAAIAKVSFPGFRWILCDLRQVP